MVKVKLRKCYLTDNGKFQAVQYNQMQCHKFNVVHRVSQNTRLGM